MTITSQQEASSSSSTPTGTCRCGCLQPLNGHRYRKRGTYEGFLARCADRERKREDRGTYQPDGSTRKRGQPRIEYSRNTVRAALEGKKGAGRWAKVLSGKAVKFDHHPHSWGDWAPLPERPKDPERRAWLKSRPTAGVLAPLRDLASGQERCWPEIQRWTVAVDSTPVERLREARYVISCESTYPEHLKVEWPSSKVTATAPEARYAKPSRWGDPADRRTRNA
jgi:hypothetical protein